MEEVVKYTLGNTNVQFTTLSRLPWLTPLHQNNVTYYSWVQNNAEHCDLGVTPKSQTAAVTYYKM